MKLTKEKAISMLEKARETDMDAGWIMHSYCVGETASVIADKLGLDAEHACVLGYIHDIGRSGGKYTSHVMNGYNYLKELGYDEEYCNISLVHSYLNNDCDCTAGGHPHDIPFRTEFIHTHTYTLYEKIICLCDLMCKKRRMTLEQRLIELILRKGSHDNTVYHITEAIKLKEEIESLLGCSIYDLFPDIKENL